MKTCSKCKQEKARTEFGKRAASSDGLRPCCKVCRNIQANAHRAANVDKARAKEASCRKDNQDKIRAQKAAWYIKNREAVLAKRRAYRKDNQDKIQACKLKGTFGVTAEWFNRQCDLQGHVCAICNAVLEDKAGKGRTLAVDHCHETGQVRELLCSTCNTALGGFKDCSRLLLSAADYLIKHQRAAVHAQRRAYFTP